MIGVKNYFENRDYLLPFENILYIKFNQNKFSEDEIYAIVHDIDGGMLAIWKEDKENFMKLYKEWLESKRGK